ncbi:hypothetical protein NP493_808g01005 [Ridgeia piscesae]|uniref:Uncharacterized protein n=1 Tax=Ridgeia piscesae TaxID=27915 RepID=A0AAD9KN70_RIDPI|nr:hypothetical protein NP493_808g01005 [Ridgeia piscesae]
MPCRRDNQLCHCPCYVTTGFKPCENSISEQSENEDLCTPEAPEVTYSSPVKNESEWVATLQPCFPTRCPDMRVKSECDVYVDCEWCEPLEDGKSSPCHKRGQCPRRPSPSESSSVWSGYTIIGAAVGTVVAVAVVAAVVVCVFGCRTTQSADGSKTNEYDNAPQVTGAPEVEPTPEGFYEELTPFGGDPAGDGVDSADHTSVSG